MDLNGAVLNITSGLHLLRAVQVEVGQTTEGGDLDYKLVPDKEGYDALGIKG
jgi:hypothetical protein